MFSLPFQKAQDGQVKDHLHNFRIAYKKTVKIHPMIKELKA